jgi:hypothetical protein
MWQHPTTCITSNQQHGTITHNKVQGFNGSAAAVKDAEAEGRGWNGSQISPLSTSNNACRCPIQRLCKHPLLKDSAIELLGNNVRATATVSMHCSSIQGR